MPRRNLLLCFDAFGTLFVPKRPIAEQYAAVARDCGLTNVTAAQVKPAFKHAFAAQSALHPNYGRASGMGAERWWTNVIHQTFSPLLPTTAAIVPPDLAPKLLHRFSSAQGYVLTAPALPELLRAATRRLTADGGVVVRVGVITNSDDRVWSILAALGVRTPRGPRPWDVDVHCASYEVGHAKPDRRIFDEAAAMARRSLAAEGSAEEWVKVYVGDEFEADVVGGLGAGWHAVLVGDDAVDRGLLPEGVEGPRELDLEDERMAPERVLGLGGGDDKGLVFLKADGVGTVLRWLAGMGRQ